MNHFDQIDRSLVAIFDIEEFSEYSQEKMAQLVQSFLNLLSDQVQTISDLHPDSFSTGDGAIISIGRQCHVDADSTKRFLQFAIGLTANLCRDGVIVRTALNYSEGDRIVSGTANALAGQYIQVGDTINIAARVVTFCEPREIMVTAAIRKLLRSHELLDQFPLHHNESLITKHGLKLDTFTYEPSNDLKGVLYSPNAPVHDYKRFTAFPPLKPQTLAQFMVAGLDKELRKVVSNAYDAMSYINDTKTFLSASEVLQVLTRDNYDPKDTVYIISRDDKPTGFWTQKRRHQYTSFLADNAKKFGGYINQTRIRIYDDQEETDRLMPGDDIFHQLTGLHAPKTFYSFPASLLHPFERISELIFGFTISKRHKYVIISIPGAETIDPRQLRSNDFGDLLRYHKNYDAADGPMKAIISADESYVDSLIGEFEKLLFHPSAHLLK